MIKFIGKEKANRRCNIRFHSPKAEFRSRKRSEAFRQATHTSKALFLTMITTYGVEPYYSTLERMDELFHTTDDPVLSDEFDLLSLLIGKYEEDQFPIKEADPIQVIKMNMELYEKIRCGHPR